MISKLPINLIYAMYVVDGGSLEIKWQSGSALFHNKNLYPKFLNRPLTRFIVVFLVKYAQH